MSLFQKSVVIKHLRNLDKKEVEIAFQKFRENFNRSKIEKIKLLNEEEYQDGFLRDLFVEVLGYILKPADNYNLVREFKNATDGKKADGAIIKNNNAIAVIELKSTKTKDLKSVTEQAFNYKNNQPECKYVITSNFQKLRFYIDYANEFEEFDLFNLRKADFDFFYLLLNSGNIFSGLPLKLKEETKFHEQQISDKLYNDYSDFRSKLFENLVKKNPEFDKLTLFNKTQKLLDRFLFILFAEDSGLLPPNSISRIIDTYNKLVELDAYKPIYDIYKQYFGYLNIGRKGKTGNDDIPAYNGGLFYFDETLDELKIDDEILIKDLLNLSEYDFNTDVDVNILGHIFEHSLNDIEEITAKLIFATDMAVEHAPLPLLPSLPQTSQLHTSRPISKRKREGVFYTPKYITQYIIENTLGELCNEKRRKLKIEEIEFDGTLNDYKEWLFLLKIIDPACGSGAFLNQALNFLILEHKTIDDIIAELTAATEQAPLLRLFDTEKSILENNLYGVDINEESVEIAKLSLWLRTAHKDRKLSNLNNNIKCGNSLISDSEIAGKKTFIWEEEFPQVFKTRETKFDRNDIEPEKPDYVKLIKEKTLDALKKSEEAIELSKEAINISKEVYEYAGKLETVHEPQSSYGMDKAGFDVVIGNPPYFSLSTLDTQFQKYFKKKYVNADKNSDIYCLFYELGIKLLKPNGIISFITSNQWLQAQYGKVLRDYFVRNINPVELINFGGFRVFKDATVDSAIFTGRKQRCEFNLNACKFTSDYENGENIKSFIEKNKVVVNDLKAEKWFIVKQNIHDLRNKIKAGKPILKNHNVEIYRGILTGLNEAFIIDTEKKEELCRQNPENLKIIKPVLRGRDIHRYSINWAGLWLINMHNGYKDTDRVEIEDYPSLKIYLNNFRPKLESRADKGKTPYNLRNCTYIDLFEKEKIIYPETTVRRSEFYRDTEGFFIDKTAFMIVGENLGYYQSVLSSKLVQWYLEFDLRLLGKNSIQYSKIFVENTPIPIPDKETLRRFTNNSGIILQKDNKLREKKTKFLNRVRDNFELKKLSKKLDGFYDYGFRTFVEELKKLNIKLSLNDQVEWEDFFNTYKSEINNLQSEISLVINDTDRMVYMLYELTEEEIKIIEG
ncbi:MAG: hypothetical protein B6D61_00175 [Bacteroidetes bacterium 4484_249]|nr:MAG: hypothetical protein B6D61_00175 [Bacteroidetes bacterium 4484_249]